MTRYQMVSAISDLQIPGFGSVQFGERSQPDGTGLAGYSVEVPRADKERVLVFRGCDDAYTLIDDFVCSAVERIMQVRREGGRLIYSSLEGKQVLVRPFTGG